MTTPSHRWHIAATWMNHPIEICECCDLQRCITPNSTMYGRRGNLRARKDPPACDGRKLAAAKPKRKKGA